MWLTWHLLNQCLNPIPPAQATQPSAGNQGTRLAPYQKHQDRDQSAGTSAGGPVYYNTITAMPQYQNKSVEELRWEDYQVCIVCNG